MRALVFDGLLRFVPDWPNPLRGPSQSLVRVRSAGICGTDIEITHGYKGFVGVLGHEFVGEVAESDDPTSVGQRVCGEINLACGNCRFCQEGLVTHCMKRSVLGVLGHDGAFAEWLVLPDRNLHRIPDTLSDEQAVFVEPLAAAFQICEQVDLGSVQSVCVLGDGRLGSLTTMALRASGCDPLLVGKHDEKMRKLRSLGVRCAHIASTSLSNVDLVIEATGSSSGMALALEWVRPRGTVVLKTTVAGGASADLSIAVVKELTLIGSRCGPFERAIEALAGNEVEVRPLISDRFPLEDGVRAFHRATEGDAFKVLLTF